MQRTFCNICNREIEPNALTGGIMRNKNIYPVIPVPGAIVGPSDQPSQVIQKRIIPEIWDLCESCQKWIWEIVEKRKEELQKDSEEKLPVPTGKPKSTLIKKP